MKKRRKREKLSLCVRLPRAIQPIEWKNRSMRCDACNCTLLNRFLVVAPSVLAIVCCLFSHAIQILMCCDASCTIFSLLPLLLLLLLLLISTLSFSTIASFCLIFLLQHFHFRIYFYSNANYYLQSRFSLLVSHTSVCLCLISIVCEYRVSETEFHLKISISNRFHCAAALPHHNGAVRVHHHQTIQLRMMCVFNQIAIDNDVHM